MLILSDFDGTICETDTCDYFIKEKYGVEEYKKLKDKPHNYFYNYFNVNKDELISIIKCLNIDKHFKKFHMKCKDENIDLKIISSGFKQVIKYFIKDDIDIIANDLNNINKNFNKKYDGRFIYIGDGRSDFEIVKYADHVFTKKNSVLTNYCFENNIDHTEFNDFYDIYKNIFYKKIPYKLFSPGVVRSRPETLEALAYQHTFMHRNEEFHELYKKVDNAFKKIVGDEFTTMLVTGSGTTSMDEVISSQVLNHKTLILSNGMFGERWQEIGEYYGDIFKIKKKWGEVFDIDEIANYVKLNKIESVIMVHCDTSTGILNDIDSIGEKLKDVNFIVDCVSTFGSIPINSHNKDMIILNPNKALASHMGLGIILTRSSVIEKIKNKKCGGYSLNLYRHYNYAVKYETCNSVSISSLHSLMVNLETFKIKDMTQYYNMLYDNIKYDKLLPRNISSPCVITILSNNSNKIINHLKNNYFIVYECKKHLYGKAFQISLFGHDINFKNIDMLIYLINGFI